MLVRHMTNACMCDAHQNSISSGRLLSCTLLPSSPSSPRVYDVTINRSRLVDPCMPGLLLPSIPSSLVEKLARVWFIISLIGTNLLSTVHIACCRKFSTANAKNMHRSSKQVPNECNPPSSLYPRAIHAALCSCASTKLPCCTIQAESGHIFGRHGLAAAPEADAAKDREEIKDASFR